jgi:hypothetical protein
MTIPLYSRIRPHLLWLGILAVLAAVAFVPARAGAATVVNGNFETGTLAGWQVVNVPPAPENTGNWFAYAGTTSPFSPEFGEPVPPPPAGNFAAISDQGGGGTHIMYQDVALEPYYSHTLSLLVYYASLAPLVTPSPNTLNATGVGAPPNQQYRIDVMRPTAPIESVNPADILLTVFATKTGDPEAMGPIALSAPLTQFAGQTIRLRFAEADNQFFLRGGVDSVAIQSTPPSNAVVLGKLKLNKKNGSAKLPVTVPGAGLLTLVDAKFATASSASISAKKKRLVKSATLTATAAGTLNVPLRPTKAALKKLKEKGKLKVRVSLTFTPTGGTPATQTVKATLKLKKPKPKKR